jgi:voltage-gated potassium channel Kch
MVLITCSILHILVCWHIFIGHHFYPSWLFLLKDSHNLNSNVSIYITSLYCLITTLTTVGYGDIVCISFAERLFQLLELSLGTIIYSYIISKLGDYVKIESYATMIYNNNSAILEDIRVTHPKMPFKLYNQILHHLQTNFQQQKKVILIY